MLKTIASICKLQPLYSSRNTTEMKERGFLVRSVLTEQLRGEITTLQSAFNAVFDDVAVESSDGIGRKTEAPWVRLHSKTMSPNPRTGFYLVIHFVADGSGFYITVGCGSTIWSDGDLRPVSDTELTKRTNWARSVISSRWGTFEPFVDKISLGAKAKLPKTFEKATAIAKFLVPSLTTNAQLAGLLYQACERLNEIYIAQLEERDLTPADQDAFQLTEITRPLQKKRFGQGFGLTAPERKAIEIHAMKMALEHLGSQGFACTDTSSNQSFDILAKKDGEELKVEVKGTTSDLCEIIMMTKNEVELHRSESGKTALVLVSSIRLNKMTTPPETSGGNLEALLAWDINTWSIQPIAYQVSRG